MRRVLWLIGVPLAALAGGAAGAAPVFVMGLSVSMLVVGPLTLLSGALLATLCASWTANLAEAGASARTRSRLPEIFAVSSLAFAVGAAVDFAAAEVFNALDLTPSLHYTLMIYLPGGIIFALATAAATWKLRAPAEGRAGGAALVLTACGAWVAFLAVVGGLAHLLGLAPPGFGVGTPVAVFVGGGIALAVVGAFLAARRTGLVRDAWLSLGAVGVLPAVIGVSIYLGCAVVACGP